MCYDSYDTISIAYILEFVNIFVGGDYMRVQANHDLRAELRAAAIPLWAVAEKLGCCENTVIRKLRTELSAEDKQAFVQAIKDIKAGS